MQTYDRDAASRPLKVEDRAAFPAEIKPALPAAMRDPPPVGVVGPNLGVALRKSALIVVLVALGLYIIQGFLPAFLWAFVLALATWPLYRQALRRLHPFVAAGLFTIAYAALIIGPVALLGVGMRTDIASLVDLINGYRTTGIPVPGWVSMTPLFGQSIVNWWTANLSDPQAAADLLGRIDSDALLSGARSLGAEVAWRVTILLLTLFILFFAFRDGAQLARQGETVLERLFGADGKTLCFDIVAAVRATVNGVVFVAIGEGILIGLCYALAGVPQPVFLGALTAAFAIIPFGAPVIFGFAALYLISHDAVVSAVAIVVVGMTIVTLADNVFRPLLIGGGSTHLPFLWALFGILGGLHAFGMIGIFIGPALLAGVVALWRDAAEPLQRPLGSE